MSNRYDEYLFQHKSGVADAYRWIEDNLPEILDPDMLGTYEWNCCYNHDRSKNDFEEYSAYDDYFYGNKSNAVVKAFDYAWLRHIHSNPHHWQYWILYEDDPKSGKPYKLLDMPEAYILEMICDWWSFGFRSGNLYELFDWYEKHKNTMLLSDKTRKRVEEIISKIKEKLDENNAEQDVDVEEDEDDRS